MQATTKSKAVTLPNVLTTLDSIIIPEISIPPTTSPLPDEEEPTALYIGHGSEFWKPFSISSTHTVMWLPPSQLPNLDAAHIVYISDVERYPGTEISIFIHPKFTEEIHIDGHISQPNFDTLISPLINLKVLEMHLSSLENLNVPRKIGFPQFMNLPKLESLQISSYNFGKRHVPIFKLEKAVQNVCSLLTKTFPNLSYLSVSLPLLRKKDKELSQSLLKSARIHYMTLKSLNIELTFDASMADDNNSKSTFTDSTDQEDFTDAKGLQLHSFHYFSTFKTDTTILWRNFLVSQVKLEYVQFWCGEKYFQLLTPVILQNSPHLHTIALNINPLLGTKAGVKRSHIDCGVFSKCYLLKTLVLKGKPLGNIDPLSMSTRSLTEILKRPNIVNCYGLPKGLEHCRLIHLKMHRKDASAIARDLPLLTRLYLEDIGFEDDFGMTLADLAALLEKPEKRLIHLDIHNGLNKASFEEIQTNHGGFAVVAKLLFKLHNPNSFQVELINGEYDTVDLENPFGDENDVLVEKEVFHENFKGMVTEEDLKDSKDIGPSKISANPGAVLMARRVSHQVNTSTQLKHKTASKITNMRVGSVDAVQKVRDASPRILTSQYQGKVKGKASKQSKD